MEFLLNVWVSYEDYLPNNKNEKKFFIKYNNNNKSWKAAQLCHNRMKKN